MIETIVIYSKILFSIFIVWRVYLKTEKIILRNSVLSMSSVSQREKTNSVPKSS